MEPFSWKDDLWKIILVAVVLAVATLGSSSYGVPEPLPGAAMSWPLLFHIERAALLLGAPAAAVFVGWKALRGEFPRRFGGLEYPAQEADVTTLIALSTHERRIRLLEMEIFQTPSSVEEGGE